LSGSHYPKIEIPFPVPSIHIHHQQHDDSRTNHKLA
jgi:hypothetical protein